MICLNSRQPRRPRLDMSIMLKALRRACFATLSLPPVPHVDIRPVAMRQRVSVPRWRLERSQQARSNGRAGKAGAPLPCLARRREGGDEPPPPAGCRLVPGRRTLLRPPTL